MPEQTPAKADLLRPLEVARYLGVGRNLAYSLINSGIIASIAIGQRRVVRRETLDRWLAAREGKKGR